MRQKITRVRNLLHPAKITKNFINPDFNEEHWRNVTQTAQKKNLFVANKQNGRYFNPWHSNDRKPRDLLFWLISRKQKSNFMRSYDLYPPVYNDGHYLSNSNAPNNIIMVGHSCLAWQQSRQVILFDPFLTNRASHFKRFRKTAFGAEAFPHGTTVVISHNHYDHLDKKSILSLQKQGSRFFCPGGGKSLLNRWGVKNIVELD